MPKGAIVTQKGERKDKFYRIEVELEDRVVEGWVPEDALSAASKGNVKDEKAERTDEVEEEGPTLRPSSKIRVPKDEGLLLRREQTFLYGIHLAPELDYLTTDIDSDTYLGWGFTVGGHFGIFAAQNLSFHAEVNYGYVQGTGNSNGTLLQFGFVDFNAQVRYLIERFEVAGGVQYSLGISLNDVPPALNIGSAFDLSSLYLIASVGYRFPLTDVLNLSVRARYAVSFLRAPVAITRFGLFFYLEFGG